MISKIPIEKSFDNSVEESKFHSDSDGDSALMEDAQSETVSSSITTTGSSSLSDDENLSNSHKTQIDQIEQILSTKNKEKLVRFAKSSGFADIRYRKEIWPRIIDAPRYCPVEFDSSRNQFVVTNKFYAAGSNFFFLLFRTESEIIVSIFLASNFLFRTNTNRVTSILWTSQNRRRTNNQTISSK